MKKSSQLALGTYAAAFLLAIAYAVLAAAHIAAQPAPKTIWDGVYTKEQAARGQELYNKRCGFCHRGDLSGGEVGAEVAPAMNGPVFAVRWRGPLSQLFFKIADDMPKDDPGSLTDEAIADIISFLIFANEAQLGDTELPPDPEKLKDILVTKKPG